MEKQDVHSEWQTLIILDACRFDSFQTVSSQLGLRGELQKVWSVAAETIGWYLKNWAHRYPDICLLSAHPLSFWSNKYEIHKRFGEAHRLWSEDVIDWYDDAYNSVNSAVNHIKESSLSRFFIHLMPPHLPYIGVQGKAFLKRLGYPEKLQGTSLCTAITKYGREHGWNDLRSFYEDSLKELLLILQRNQKAFQGKTVITSDHGELIGEHNYYLHGGEGTFYPVTPALHEVPWFNWHLS